MSELSQIVVAAPSPLPYLTTANALGQALDLPVQHHDLPQPDAINLGPPEFVGQVAGPAQLLQDTPANEPWDLLYQGDNDGWLITGSTPLAAAHAALQLLDWLQEGQTFPQPHRAVRTRQFRSMELEFDDWTGGFNRLADGFDIEQHAQDIVRIGGTSLEVNMLADAVPVQVRERRCYDDMYQWWCVYSAGLDMFVESTLNRGTYDHRLLERNLAKLKQYYEIALKWGLAPTVQAFEPRVIPERFFDRYPDLRGARVDCSDYSAEAEFALDPCHPMVQEHYRELMHNLLLEAPEIARISIWSQDSNAGFPWARQLYAGPNGPRMARKQPVQNSVRALMAALRDGGRMVNPEFQATICLAWFQDHQVQNQLLPDEISDILSVLPKDIGTSFTVSWAKSDAPGASTRLDVARGEKIRSFGWEPQFQVEGLSNWWKPLGPMHGVPHPHLTLDRLRSLRQDGRVQDLIHRGGLQTSVFVPNYINSEVIRAFNLAGEALDLESLLVERARAWTDSAEEAQALLQAWRLGDEAVRHVQPLTWTVNFVSGRTLWRRLVRPLVPDQSLLAWEDWRHYRHLEFTVGPTDPAWIDHFYKGWGRMLGDDRAVAGVLSIEQDVLPPLAQAIAGLDQVASLTDTSRDVRDRLRCLYHVLVTDRNLIETQEAIHACLAESREHPENSLHRQRLLACIDAELVNTREFRELIESSPSRLIPETSGEETTYMHKAPFAWQLACKIKGMERHRDDSPGPWFDELGQPGGWTSDLAPQLATLTRPLLERRTAP